MRKKILVPCFDVITIDFLQFSIRNMVFHCIFLGEKGGTNTTQGSFFQLESYFKKICPEKRSKIQTKCAHAP